MPRAEEGQMQWGVSPEPSAHLGHRLQLCPRQHGTLEARPSAAARHGRLAKLGDLAKQVQTCRKSNLQVKSSACSLAGGQHPLQSLFSLRTRRAMAFLLTFAFVEAKWRR